MIQNVTNRSSSEKMQQESYPMQESVHFQEEGLASNFQDSENSLIYEISSPQVMSILGELPNHQEGSLAQVYRLGDPSTSFYGNELDLNHPIWQDFQYGMPYIPDSPWYGYLGQGPSLESNNIPVDHVRPCISSSYLTGYPPVVPNKEPARSTVATGKLYYQEQDNILQIPSCAPYPSGTITLILF